MAGTGNVFNADGMVALNERTHIVTYTYPAIWMLKGGETMDFYRPHNCETRMQPHQEAETTIVDDRRYLGEQPYTAFMYGLESSYGAQTVMQVREPAQNQRNHVQDGLDNAVYLNDRMKFSSYFEGVTNLSMITATTSLNVQIVRIGVTYDRNDRNWLNHRSRNTVEFTSDLEEWLELHQHYGHGDPDSCQGNCPLEWWHRLEELRLRKTDAAYNQVAAFAGLFGINVRSFDAYTLKVRWVDHLGYFLDARNPDDQCAICLDEWNKMPDPRPVELSCGHAFCEECISNWLQTNNTCPMDRQQPAELRSNFVENVTMDKLYHRALKDMFTHFNDFRAVWSRTHSQPLAEVCIDANVFLINLKVYLDLFKYAYPLQCERRHSSAWSREVTLFAQTLEHILRNEEGAMMEPNERLLHRLRALLPPVYLVDPRWVDAQRWVMVQEDFVVSRACFFIQLAFCAWMYSLCEMYPAVADAAGLDHRSTRPQEPPSPYTLNNCHVQ